MQNILILCTGNICRSPMAAALFKHELQKSKIEVTSAGISALVDKSAVPFAQEVMLEKKNLDISAHRARQVTQPLLLSADLILVMELQQKRQIEFILPSVCGRVLRLGQWSSFDIPDPYQRSKQVFEQTLMLIEQCLHDWQTHL